MPDSPAISRFHEDDTEGPRGLSIPRPVTTTLRAAMGNVKVQPSINRFRDRRSLSALRALLRSAGIGFQIHKILVN